MNNVIWVHEMDFRDQHVLQIVRSQNQDVETETSIHEKNVTHDLMEADIQEYDLVWSQNVVQMKMITVSVIMKNDQYVGMERQMMVNLVMMVKIMMGLNKHNVGNIKYVMHVYVNEYLIVKN